MNKTLYKIIFLIIITSTLVFPQLNEALFPEVYWTNSFNPGDNGGDAKVAVAPNGDVAASKPFYDHVGFFNKADSSFITIYSGQSGKSNIYLVVHDSSGGYKYNKNFGAINNDNELITGIQYDAGGNLYVCGKFKDSMKVDELVILSDKPSIFLSKIDPQGNVLWLKSIAVGNSTNVGSVFSEAFTISPSGEILVIGRGAPTIETITLNDHSYFIAKYNLSGEVIWAKPFYYTELSGNFLVSALTFSDLVVDNNSNIFVTGAFRGTQTFGTTTLTSHGHEDILTLKLDSTGEILWASGGGGSLGEDYGVSIALNKNQELYVAGNTFGNVTFGDFTFDSSNTVLIKYNQDGSHSIVKNYIGVNIPDERLITFDAENNLLLAAGFYTTIDAKVEGEYYKSQGITDILFIKYTSALDFILTKHYGTFYDEAVHALTTGPSNELYCFWYSFAPGRGVSLSKIKSITSSTTAITKDENLLPDNFILYQNFPNPFNPTTSIQYLISDKQFVSLKVYDILGNEIAELVNEEKPAGTYEINFSADELSSGIYFYKISAEKFVQTKKMLLMK